MRREHARSVEIDPTRLYGLDRTRPVASIFCVLYFDCSTCNVVNWFTVPFTPSLVPSGPVESTV